MDKVVHYVFNRFPVIGADAAVTNYNQIERLRPADVVLKERRRLVLMLLDSVFRPRAVNIL